MTERQDVTVYIAISHEGAWAVGPDADLAREAFENEIGGTSSLVVREITLSVPLPADSVPGGKFDVPDEPAPEAVTQA